MVVRAKTTTTTTTTRQQQQHNVADNTHNLRFLFLICIGICVVMKFRQSSYLQPYMFITTTTTKLSQQPTSKRTQQQQQQQQIDTIQHDVIEENENGNDGRQQQQQQQQQRYINQTSTQAKTTATTNAKTPPETRTLAMIYPAGFFGGYRNQAMRFIAFVKHAIDNDIPQLLLPTLTFATKYYKQSQGNGGGSGREQSQESTKNTANDPQQQQQQLMNELFIPVPFEELFDVEHWNTYHYDRWKQQEQQNKDKHQPPKNRTHSITIIGRNDPKR